MAVLYYNLTMTTLEFLGEDVPAPRAKDTNNCKDHRSQIIQKLLGFLTIIIN